MRGAERVPAAAHRGATGAGGGIMRLSFSPDEEDRAFRPCAVAASGRGVPARRVRRFVWRPAPSCPEARSLARESGDRNRLEGKRARTEPGRFAGASDQFAGTVTATPLTLCNGRAFWPSILARAAICSAEAVTGFSNTNHATFSLQGGVVSEPE